jgi:hypothetical protein
MDNSRDELFGDGLPSTPSLALATAIGLVSLGVLIGTVTLVGLINLAGRGARRHR